MKCAPEGGNVVTLQESVHRAAAVIALALLFEAKPAQVSGAQLGDGTPLTVRLLGMINSETSWTGQRLEFAVMRDVIVDGQVVITKDTLVTGFVVKARRARWSLRHRRPKLTFRFGHTLACDGQLISLRSAPAGEKDGSIAVDRGGLDHELAWAGGADLFEAYTDGNYEVQCDRAAGTAAHTTGAPGARSTVNARHPSGRQPPPLAVSRRRARIRSGRTCLRGYVREIRSRRAHPGHVRSPSC
jgi:hypothetical protein